MLSIAGQGTGDHPDCNGREDETDEAGEEEVKPSLRKAIIFGWFQNQSCFWMVLKPITQSITTNPSSLPHTYQITLQTVQ